MPKTDNDTIVHFCVFADDALDLILHDDKTASKHARELRKDGYAVKTIKLRGAGADDAADFIEREVFGAFKTLSKKIKADIATRFGVEFL